MGMIQKNYLGEDIMVEVKRIHHIAVLVENIDTSLEFWQAVLGIEPSHISDYPQEDARIAFLPLGEAEIELVQPTKPDTALSRFLEKRGQGMHHLCLEVDDLQRLMVELVAKNIQLINEQPKVGEDGKLYAFIHPKSSSGVLVELYQLPKS
jgi:methylmalonyl-CoA/ethylmalonyl-CoA epimerase